MAHDTANHNWYRCSSHRTSEGIVHYDSCTCGAHRIRLAQTQIAMTSPASSQTASLGEGHFIPDSHPVR